MKNIKNTKIIIVAPLIVSFLVTITACVAVNGKDNSAKDDETEKITTVPASADGKEEIPNTETDITEYIKYIIPSIELPSGVRISKKLQDDLSKMSDDESIHVQISFIPEISRDKEYYGELAAKALGLSFNEDTGEPDWGHEPSNEETDEYMRVKHQLQEEYDPEIAKSIAEVANKHLKKWELKRNILPLTTGDTVDTYLSKKELLELIESKDVCSVVAYYSDIDAVQSFADSVS